MSIKASINSLPCSRRCQLTFMLSPSLLVDMKGNPSKFVNACTMLVGEPTLLSLKRIPEGCLATEKRSSSMDTTPQ